MRSASDEPNALLDQSARLARIVQQGRFSERQTQKAAPSQGGFSNSGSKVISLF